MENRRTILAVAAGGGFATFGLWYRGRHAIAAPAGAGIFAVSRTDAEWRKQLSPAAYRVLRQAGAEPPFSSPLLNEERTGIFSCAGCGLPIYSSKTKYDSGTGWPSFWAPLPKAVATEEDDSFGMLRTGVHCSRCGSHLGHVFHDGPPPTGLRYCMNGLALTFTAEPA
jgi:peptide-methionine (R)-S-oxide reductase